MRGLAAHQPEAVAAVDRAGAGRAERHLGVLATPGADRVEHLARTAAVSTAAVVAAAAAGGVVAAAGGAPLSSARGTALGRRRESLLREEFLLRRGEDEVDSAV